MVVVGSRCQVRNRVVGWKGASSRCGSGRAGGAAAKMAPEDSVVSEAPRKARRDARGNISISPDREGEMVAYCGSVPSQSTMNCPRRMYDACQPNYVGSNISGATSVNRT